MMVNNQKKNITFLVALTSFFNLITRKIEIKKHINKNEKIILSKLKPNGYGLFTQSLLPKKSKKSFIIISFS